LGAEILWLITAAAVPLACNPWGASGFELPKAVLLRSLGLLLLSAAVLVRSPSPRRFSALGAAAFGFGLAVALSTAWSVDPRLSLWGSFERQQGLLTTASALVVFGAVAACLRTWSQATRLLRVLVWTSAPVAAYGLLQAAGLDPLGWRTDAASSALSTLGRANFLGSYLVLIVPLTAVHLALERRRAPYALLLAVQIIVLALTGARAAWLGLAAALLTGFVAWWIAARDPRPLFVLLAFAVVLGGAATVFSMARGPMASRLWDWTDTSAGSTAARLTIWRTTASLVAARPWVGYGPDTLRPVFATAFPPQLVYYQGRNVIVDRAHNVWLDLAAASGLVGVMAFSAVIVAFLRIIWRGLGRATDRRQRLLWIALAAAAAGHLVDLQFSFEVTAGATVFWLLLGLAAALDRGLLEGCETEGHTIALAVWPALPLLAAVLALMGMACARPLVADTLAWLAAQAEVPPVARVGLAVRAVQWWPLEPEYRLRAARALGQTGQWLPAVAELDAAAALSRDDAALWAARGELQAAWAGVEPAFWPRSEADLRRAVKIAPDVGRYHAALGAVGMRLGRLPEGIAELERAVALDATDGAAFAALAGGYAALGRDADAARAGREATRWGASSSYGR
jgi:O-antigen ligase